MDKRIIYTNDEGNLAIVIPAECGLTIEEIAAKDVPQGKPFKIVDVSDIPADRTYRNAWELKAGKIEVNSAKKKVIDDEKAVKEAETLIAQKQKEMAKIELIKDGVLDANGKKK